MDWSTLPTVNMIQSEFSQCFILRENIPVLISKDLQKLKLLTSGQHLNIKSSLIFVSYCIGPTPCKTLISDLLQGLSVPPFQSVAKL